MVAGICTEVVAEPFMNAAGRYAMKLPLTKAIMRSVNFVVLCPYNPGNI
jgi:hypothetical protein